MSEIADDNGQIVSEPLFSWRDWNRAEADAIVSALNKAVNDFAGLNDLTMLKKPLAQVKVGDPNDPTLAESALDRASRWLTETDHLREEWRGSLIAQIDQLQERFLAVLRAFRNVSVERSSDGRWIASKKNPR